MAPVRPDAFKHGLPPLNNDAERKADRNVGLRGKSKALAPLRITGKTPKGRRQCSNVAHG